MYNVIIRYEGQIFDKISCGSLETAKSVAADMRKQYKRMNRTCYSVSVRRA